MADFLEYAPDSTGHHASRESLGQLDAFRKIQKSGDTGQGAEVHSEGISGREPTDESR